MPRSLPPARRARGVLPALAALLAACLAGGCGGAREIAPEAACRQLSWDGRPRAASVVLIVADTLRRDALGAYGGPAETPHFDAFAARHLRFDGAFSQAPWTKPSMVTLFTSWYPSQHQVLAPSLPEPLAAALDARDPTDRALESEGLAPEFVTLAEVLRDAGWRTAGFVANPWLGRALGFDQGFQVYDDALAAWNADGTRVSEAGLAWLHGVPGTARFLLYLHYMDPHRPYPALTLDELAEHAGALEADRRPLSDEARRAIDRLVRLEGNLSASAAGVPVSRALLELAYRKGVEHFDRALGVFLDGFAAHAAAEDAVVIVTSDHGEALYTRGYGNHGRGLHDDELAVPLAAQLPGVGAPGGAVSCTAGLVDLLPTLCDYLGVPCPEPLYGRSLLGAAAPARYLVSEGVGGRPEHRTLRNRNWKLLHTPGGGPGDAGDGPWLLYDVARDPDETRDLLAAEEPPGAAGRAFETLSAALPAAVPPTDPPGRHRARLPPDVEARLRALGYLEGEEAP